MLLLTRSNVWLFLAVLPVQILHADSQVEPGGVLPFEVCVTPVPDPPEYIQWTVDVTPYSGFHDHDDSSRPKGLLSSNGAWTHPVTGCAGPASFTAPYLAGAHTISAWGDFGWDIEEVAVIHTPYLTALPPHSKYRLVSSTAAHQSNHYGSEGTLSKLQLVCLEFYDRTNPSDQADINDISLPWGGLFDLGPDYGGTWWQPPHDEHRLGINADIPFSGFSSYANRVLWREIAEREKLAIQEETTHYHITGSF